MKSVCRKCSPGNLGDWKVRGSIVCLFGMMLREHLGRVGVLVVVHSFERVRTGSNAELVRYS